MKKRITSTFLLSLFGVTTLFAELSYDVLDSLKINGAMVEDFNVLFLEYEVSTPYPNVPEVTATTENPNATIDIELPANLPGTTVIEMRDGAIPINTYEIHFTTATEKLLEFDFNKEEAGAVPVKLEVSGGNITIVEAPDQSEMKSVFIDKTTSDTSATLAAVVPEQTGTVVFEARFLFPEEGSFHPFLTLGNEQTLSNDFPKEAAFVMETRDGAITYRTGADSHAPVVEAYNQNQWHHIKVVADVGSGDADVYINHTRVLEGVRFLNGTHAIDRFVAGSSDEAGYYLTDLIIYKVVD